MSHIAATVLIILGHAAFWAAVAVCACLVPIGLPGTWGILALAAVFALCTGFDPITGWGLLGLAVAAGAGEAIEFIGGLLGARYGGASRWGMAAAMAGGIAGAILGAVLIPAPIVGSIVGAFALSFAATVAVEYHRGRKLDGALAAGLGAFFGRVVAVVAKTSIGLCMIVWMVWAIYFRGH